MGNIWSHILWRDFLFKKTKSIINEHPILMSIGVIILLICCGLAYLYYWAFYDIGRLRSGELIMKETSPNGSYTVGTYLNNGGATVDYAVLGVLYFNNEKRDNKNIYWQYEEQDGEIIWEDNNTVTINGIKIDVPNEEYDYRRH
jgi:hypothetical protein